MIYKIFQIIEKMMSGLGDEIDPAMMSALMATTALVAAGASNEEVILKRKGNHGKEKVFKYRI